MTAYTYLSSFKGFFGAETRYSSLLVETDGLSLYSYEKLSFPSKWTQNENLLMIW